MGGWDEKGGWRKYEPFPPDAIAAGNLFVAQNDLPSEYLALAEPLACCVNGHHRSQIRLNSSVLIMGSGPIGLSHPQLAPPAGAQARSRSKTPAPPPPGRAPPGS